MIEDIDEVWKENGKYITLGDEYWCWRINRHRIDEDGEHTEVLAITQTESLADILLDELVRRGLAKIEEPLE